MAGFGATKEKELAAEAEAEKASTPATKRVDSDPYSNLRVEFEQLNKHGPKTHIFMALVGHENTGKTGIVFDTFQKYCNTGGDKILAVIDFDGGGAASKSAFYPENEQIRCWEPWVMGKGDRTAYDYPSTHDRVMSIMQFLLSEHETIWGVHVTGIDLWDSVCTNNMRIVDLGLSRDGIESADNRGAGTGQRVQMQFDWAIRTTRFHQLTAMSRALVKKGVRVFWETHLKVTNYAMGGNQADATWKPAWEKSSNNYMFQIILCERNDTLGENGEVIRSDFTATFEKSKTNAALQGQRSTILITEQDRNPNWIGLPELDKL